MKPKTRANQSQIRLHHKAYEAENENESESKPSS
ncbi:hypothetical protein J2S19_002817 [Metabacillus malikii]|uniref:Uncharacterized protein n=1 Tax=Metabacillus malikii TaxID=1504265 RepID=A0ABT9ZGX5_9BACI|nr:hypothetical protein [Metabacillus malikii]